MHVLKKGTIWMSAVLAAATLLAGCGDKGGNEPEDGSGSMVGSGSETGGGSGTEGNSGGGVSETDGSVDFTMLTLASFGGTNWIDDYNDNPAAKYWLNMEWDADGDGGAKKVNVTFWHPTSGSEQDYVNTLIMTQDYPDVMPLVYSSKAIMELYEEGIALDITEYVEKYMPNYLAYLDAHPELKNQVTNIVDGEARYLQIYDLNERQPDPWGGLMYRRDWIVKYGTNPASGTAFSGEWVGEEWVDDVVFPSGGADPVYISDWEWMIRIMETAMDDLGITDGYIVQLPYSGAEGTGDLMSGFGGVGPFWYFSDNDTVDFGAASDGMRAYLECMNTWFSNGWVNANFAENASDMFFMVDMASVYSGKVGIWYGMTSSLLGGLDSHSGEAVDPLNEAVVYAAASPINDMYGDASVQNKEPVVIYGDALAIGQYIITDKAKDKDIATLLCAIDYLYSAEGGRLKTLGLSDEQVKEIQEPQYMEWGLENGAYTLRENGDGSVTIVKEQKLIDDQDNLGEAVSLLRIMGLYITDVDTGRTENMEHCLDVWRTYDNTGTIQDGLMLSRLSPEAASAYSIGRSDLITTIAVWCPQFIDGTLDIHDDAAWQNYCNEVDSYHPETVTGYLQDALTGN